MSELDTNISMIPPFTADDRVNELAEINKELLEALKAFMALDKTFYSDRTYIEVAAKEGNKMAEAVLMARDAIAKAEQ